MNLNLLPDLALFVQIVDQGSFSAVARQNGITPSAVSRSVSRLEREMGCKLLQRTTRKLRLSDAGETVYHHAQEMLDAARQAMDSAGSNQTVAQGKLTLSVPKAVGRFVIHPLMMAFFQRYPQVDVCLRLEDRPLDFIDDGIDLALRITESPSPGLHGKPLMPIRHVICATEAYLQQHGTPRTPQDLRTHSCISLGETPADARWKFRREGKSETVQTYGRYAANHTAVRLDAVRQHVGIGSLPLFTAREALAKGDIVQVLPEWEFISSYSGDLWLLWAGDKHMPARMRVMIDYLSETVPALNAGSTYQRNNAKPGNNDPQYEPDPGAADIMHPPTANSQQRDHHQQQPQCRKGYDNKTEDPIVRVNVGGQTPGDQWRGGDQYIDKKKRQNCCRLARPLKLKVSFQPLKYACP